MAALRGDHSGDLCSVCGSQAAHKIAEELRSPEGMFDAVHELTATLCAGCFDRVFRGYGRREPLTSELEQERDTGYRWLHAWQEWSAKLHHELGLLPDDTLPDDTKGRRILAELLRGRAVAINAARYDASLLAKALVDVGAAAHPYLKPVTPVIERHYRPGELEPSGDSVPHPYRMTLELAELLTRLIFAVESDPTAVHAEGLAITRLLQGRS